MAQLTIGDADGLQDLADRCRRAAQTATDTAADETDQEAAAMLRAVSDGAVGLAGMAGRLAAWIEENR